MSDMRDYKAVMLPGSYDPVTVGHLDLILRSAEMFDKVYAVIFANTEKNSHGGGMFSPSERLDMLTAVCSAASQATGKEIRACLYGGLASDFAKENGIKFIVKGARGAVDYDYEAKLADIMRRFDPALETIILTSKPELSAISSTYCRDLIKYGCSLDGAVPSEAIEIIKKIRK